LPARIGISSVVTQDQRRLGTADADRAIRRSPISVYRLDCGEPHRNRTGNRNPTAISGEPRLRS